MVILHKDIIEDLEFKYPIIKENNWTLYGYPVELYHDGTPSIIQIHGGKRPPSLRRVHHAYERTITNIHLEFNPTHKGQEVKRPYESNQILTFGNQYSMDSDEHDAKWLDDFNLYHNPEEFQWEEFERNNLEDELVLLTSILNTTRVDNSVIDDLIDFRFIHQRILNRFEPMFDWRDWFNEYDEILYIGEHFDRNEWVDMQYIPQMLKIKNFVTRNYPFKKPMCYRVVSGTMACNLEEVHDYPHPIYQCVDEGKKMWLNNEEFDVKMDNVYKYLALKNRFLNPQTKEWEFKSPYDLLNNYKQNLWKLRSK